MDQALKHVILNRTKTGDDGTFGVLEVDGLSFQTGELPDRANAPEVSSIPAGTYLCRWTFSPRFNRNTYELENVPGRTAIRIHPANLMGDATKGLKCELNGCIALGMVAGDIGGQEAVLRSREALTDFELHMAAADFELEIRDEYLETGAPNERTDSGAVTA